MRLAISNIAWGPGEDEAVAAICRETGVEAIEVAPGRLSDDPLGLSEAEVSGIAEGWRAVGLPIVSMQALLFGRPELLLFGPDDGKAMVDYLARVFRFAGALGAGPAVFGSPKNRARGDLGYEAAVAAALPVFRKLGALAAAEGVTFCLEANAEGYGCDFMTRLGEAAAVVRAADHPGVGLIVDTGNMEMAGDAPGEAADHADIARHFHISRPQLAPVGEDAFPREVLKALAGAGYDGVATIEMRRHEADPLGAIRRAAECVRTWIDAA